MRYYHGSSELFHKFDESKAGRNFSYTEMGNCLCFTKKKGSAINYAYLAANGEHDGYVYEVA